MKTNKVFAMLLPILLVGFLFGVVKLFLLRFEAGDIYPTYSSLRADPLGTKVFFESLNNLPNMTARRSYRPARAPSKTFFPSQTSDSQKTTFYLGVRPEELNYIDKDSLDGLESLVTDGGRLVISFFPVAKKVSSAPGQSATVGEKAADNASEEAKGQKSVDPVSQPAHEDKKTSHEKSLAEEDSMISLEKRWGVRFAYLESSAKDKEAPSSVALLKKNFDALPSSLSWHTALYFDQPDQTWQVIYSYENHPVIIRRPLGRGTLILSADSYFFSNEAMLRERHSGLLTWLTGPSSEVIFDETHLGVRENPGIAALVRRYRLHGFFAGILLLTGLFVWKNSVPFLPPYDNSSDEEQNTLPTARDYTEGLTSLLRRNISPRNLLTVCFREWKKSAGHSKEVSEEKIGQVQSILESESAKSYKDHDPVETYRVISRILDKSFRGGSRNT